MAREDIQYELRAVNHAALGGRFDVALLKGGEVAVKNNQRRFVRGGLGANLVEFAAAHQGCRVGGFAHLENRPGNFRARAARQFPEFCQGLAALFSRGHARKARRAFPSHPD